MQLAVEQWTLLENYLDCFAGLIGNRRTGRRLRATVQGITGAESLVCARIAAFSPELQASRNGEQRVRRMAKGTGTERSALDAEHLTARLHERGAEQLRGEDEVWAILVRVAQALCPGDAGPDAGAQGGR